MPKVQILLYLSEKRIGYELDVSIDREVVGKQKLSKPWIVY